MPSFLQNFRRQLAQLTSPQVRHDLAAEVSRDFARRIDQGFDLERDPYGVPWLPSKKLSGKTLTRTGQLRGGLFVDADPQGHRVTVSVAGTAKLYARYPMTGTRTMPQRRFMPDDQGLPREWERGLEQVHDRYFERRWAR